MPIKNWITPSVTKSAFLALLLITCFLFPSKSGNAQNFKSNPPRVYAFELKDTSANGRQVTYDNMLAHPVVKCIDPLLRS